MSFLNDPPLIFVVEGEKVEVTKLLSYQTGNNTVTFTTSGPEVHGPEHRPAIAYEWNQKDEKKVRDLQKINGKPAEYLSKVGILYDFGLPQPSEGITVDEIVTLINDCIAFGAQNASHLTIAHHQQKDNQTILRVSRHTFALNPNEGDGFVVALNVTKLG